MDGAIYRTKDLKVDIKEFYTVVCEKHGTMVGASIKNAYAVSQNTASFCDGCRDEPNVS